VPRFSIKVESFKPQRAHTLVGFTTITVPELHLRIIDLPVHATGESRWANMPARPIIGNNGFVRRDARGRVAYTPALQFTDAKTRRRFSEVVIDQLIKFAPHAFRKP
jgi:hypothetical protein